MQEYIIPDVAFRGISIKQLKEIYSEIEVRCEIEGWVDNNGILLTPDKVCLYDIIDRIIKARSERYQCSYVELIAIRSQKPTRFVSHWWGEPVISMIRCLEQHCIDHNLSEETSYYWICVSNSYNDDKSMYVVNKISYYVSNVYIYNIYFHKFYI